MSAGILLFSGRYGAEPPREAASTMVAYAAQAERTGWDAVWTTEHHFNPKLVSSSALVTAAFLAGRTERITIGTAVTVLPNYHPLMVAEQANLINHLSDGRFRLGLARGLPLLDNQVLGAGRAGRPGAFEESLRAVVAGLTGEPVEGSGDEFPFPPLAVSPAPQAGAPVPVSVAASSPATAAIAARLGLPLMLSHAFPTAARVALLEHYANVASEHGHDPATIEHVDSVLIQVERDRETALEVLAKTHVPWFIGANGSFAAPPGTPAELQPPQMPAAAMEGMLQHQPLGTPEQCAETLAAHLAQTGCRHVIVTVDGTCDRDRALENIEAIGTEILPHVSLH